MYLNEPQITQSIPMFFKQNCAQHKDSQRQRHLGRFLWYVQGILHSVLKRSTSLDPIDRSPIECVRLMTTTVTEMLDPVFHKNQILITQQSISQRPLTLLKCKCPSHIPIMKHTRLIPCERNRPLRGPIRIWFFWPKTS